jgi:hypothetical protein
MGGFVKGGKMFNRPSSSRPSEFRTEGNIEKARQLLLQNRRPSLRMIADELDISKDNVRKTVVEDTKKGNFARFVPHALTEEQ